MDPPSVPVAITFTGADPAKGDREIAIPPICGCLKSDRPAAGWPVLLFVCGLDAYRTDHAPRTQEHVDRGCAVLSFEIPGTGNCPAARTTPPRRTG